MKFTLNKILLTLAVTFSVFALVANNPFSNGKSFVTPAQLADSLIAKKQNLEIVDLRNKKDFDDYHIPSSINIISDSVEIKSLAKNKMIVFYSGRNNDSKTIQYKFENSGYNKVYFLKDGIDGWMNKVIFPVLPKNASKKEKEAFKKIERRSMYFGGQPEREGDNTKKSYRREGC